MKIIPEPGISDNPNEKTINIAEGELTYITTDPLDSTLAGYLRDDGYLGDKWVRDWNRIYAVQEVQNGKSPAKWPALGITCGPLVGDRTRISLGLSSLWLEELAKELSKRGLIEDWEVWGRGSRSCPYQVVVYLPSVTV